MKRLLLFTTALMLSLSTYAQERGYEKSVEIKGAIGLDERADFGFGAYMVNGYRFNPYLFVGAGVGYEFLKGLYYHIYQYKGQYLPSSSHDSKENQSIIQLYARIKANFTNSRISPYVSLDLGNSFNLNSTDEIKMAKGFFFEPALGCDFRFNEKQTFYVALGYNNQHYEYEFISTTLGNAGHEIMDKPSGTFNVHLGLKF